MAYNLQSLITILEQILDPQETCFIRDDNKPQLKSLLEKAISLQLILEKHSLPNIEMSLERQIRDAVHKAEDIIELRVVRSKGYFGQLLIQQGKFISFPLPDLQLVTQQLDSAMEQVVKLVEAQSDGGTIISSRGSSSSSSGGASLNPKSVEASASGSIHVVGFDEDLIELKDRLTSMQKKLEIIPIVGMGGAGKTTLARNLYEDPTIVSRFVARAWATVSQDYSIHTILLSLLSCITGKKVVDPDVSVLKQSLHESLFGRRYLIVLDDIWSSQVWEELRMFLPDNNNGSRILITTRESNVAECANSKSQQHHEVQLLSESASWNLLRQIVFGVEDKLDGCPFELESIGRKIVSDCGGLPLAITVIGGLLSKVDRLKDVWQDIGKNVRAAISNSNEGEKYSNIMSLSYKHLPNYLKPCFLYMGAFPEDYEIKGLRLIRLWIAEGFVKSNRDKSLEEVAEEYLNGLVERNLLMVRQKKSNGKAKSYIMHDVLRDLCIRKADEDNFLHVINFKKNDFAVSKLRRVKSEHRYSEGIYASLELMSLVRSFLFAEVYYEPHEIINLVSSTSNLLRVFDMEHVYLNEFPEEILQLVNLRYLSVQCHNLPVGISRLENLQTLIARVIGNNAPSEIWKMSGLRHLKLGDWIEFSEDDDIKQSVKMNKLQTISPSLKLTQSLHERGFLQTIPNIKNLGVSWRGDFDIDLSHLHKLETLRYKCLSNDQVGCLFPPSLRKLTLTYCGMNWRTTSTLCGLPNLEVLNMFSCRFEEDSTGAQEWEVREGEEFSSLQSLQLYDMRLVHWRADDTNFPKLRQLRLQGCKHLKEIPSGIGEILTLKSIEMKKCSASAVESAKQILEEQQSDYGNYSLQLHIHE